MRNIPLTAAEKAWLEQWLPQVPEAYRESADHWISEGSADRPYIVSENFGGLGEREVLLDGYFTYAQVLALAGILRLRQGAADIFPGSPDVAR